jgi:proline dehydrogenase
MLRSLLIYLSTAGWARKIVTRWSIAWKAASRFIAGEKLEDAIRVIQGLNAAGITATLDHLGENTTNIQEAQASTQDILEIIDAIENAQVQANVSIKLTQIGLLLDEDLCVENLRKILSYAKEKNNFVRIDMEDSSSVETTLRLYFKMRQEFGFNNTGLVLQAYLYRSQADLAKVVENAGRVRLCKGAYKEAPDVAFPKKKDVDANYDQLAEMLVDAAIAHGAQEVSPDGKTPPIPAIASHDPSRLEHVKAYLREKGLPKRALEFQMLHGIRRDLQEQTAKEGYPVRIYVPYGTEWYPYYVRRLAERPANLWFFISNFFRK